MAIKIINMKYYLELRIQKFIQPDALDELIRKPLAENLLNIGNVTIASPEYQSFQAVNGDLLKIDFDGKILYFKYIKVSISLINFSEGVKKIEKFTTDLNMRESSTLLFQDERYDLFNIYT